MIAGIILAAGASTRMGSPKALLEYGSETFLDRLIRILSDVADPIIVAVGIHADAIRERVRRSAKFVVNPDPDRGQLSSLQIALREVPTEAEGFLFVPVDCPAVTAETAARLASAFARCDRSTLLVIPRFEGRRGHPVFAARELIDEFLNLPPTGQAREVVHRYVDRTEYLDVDDAGILSDIDDPAAYRRLVETFR